MVGEPARHTPRKVFAAQVDLRIQALPDRWQANPGAHEVFVTADGAGAQLTELTQNPVRRQPGGRLDATEKRAAQTLVK